MPRKGHHPLISGGMFKQSTSAQHPNPAFPPNDVRTLHSGFTPTRTYSRVPINGTAAKALVIEFVDDHLFLFAYGLALNVVCISQRKHWSSNLSMTTCFCLNTVRCWMLCVFGSNSTGHRICRWPLVFVYSNGNSNSNSKSNRNSKIL